MPSNESRISNEPAFWAFVIIAMNFHRIIYPALITLTYWLKRDNPIEACRQKSRLTIYIYLQGTLTNCIFMEKISFYSLLFWYGKPSSKTKATDYIGLHVTLINHFNNTSLRKIVNSLLCSITINWDEWYSYYYIFNFGHACFKSTFKIEFRLIYCCLDVALKTVSLSLKSNLDWINFSVRNMAVNMAAAPTSWTTFYLKVHVPLIQLSFLTYFLFLLFKY